MELEGLNLAGSPIAFLPPMAAQTRDTITEILNTLRHGFNAENPSRQSIEYDTFLHR